MSTAVTPTIPVRSSTKPAPPASVRSKIRAAIAYKVDKLTTVDEACREAGCSPAGYYKAMNKPEVAKWAEELEAYYIEQADRLRRRYRADAIHHARKLMLEAKSEAVQARMVEFLARDPESASTSITINSGGGAVGVGYAYVPPGAQVVKVTDDVSGAQDAQVIEGKAEDV